MRGSATPEDFMRRRFKRSKIGCQIQKKSKNRKQRKRNNCMECHVLMQDFLVRFSAAGVGKIINSGNPWRKIIWSILVLATALLMSYMTYKVTKEYFEYKKIVEQTSVILSSMKFPAVTICSPVTLPKSRVNAAGAEHLLRLEQFFANVERDGSHVNERQVCNSNPACMWSWFHNECACLSNPCKSEYCESGHPICVCSSLLCDQYPGSCFHLYNITEDHDDLCFCRNRIEETISTDAKDHPSNASESLLQDIKDIEVRNLLAVIRNAKVDDLTDVQWAFQPNIYSIANFGTSFDNLIIGCSFHKKRCDRRNFTVLYTPTHGKCYTFNYAGELARNAEFLETKRYGWNSGLQLYLQIREDEIVNILSKDIGVIVTVHDPHELPYVSEYGLTVRAGDSAALRVERLQVNRLGSPWGKCLTSGMHLPFNYSDIPYSQLGCQRYCQNHYIHQNCNCFKRSLLPPSLRRPKKQNLHMICNFRITSQRQCAEEVVELIENETIQCNCYQACREVVFHTSLTAGNINKNYFRLIKSAKTFQGVAGNWTSPSDTNESNILGLKVYYGTLSLHNMTERPAYSWETLIANIGGNLGFFMGLTLITFLEVAELLCDMLLFLMRIK